VVFYQCSYFIIQKYAKKNAENIHKSQVVKTKLVAKVVMRETEIKALKQIVDEKRAENKKVNDQLLESGEEVRALRAEVDQHQANEELHKESTKFLNEELGWKTNEVEELTRILTKIQLDV
jgi:hypothetical protein